mmetsp:Transcript_177873/g.570537  ORF Transcript_177873/g.570537 Transcript_177873/m.570537 type:complete len:241 (-) Transcript_177873:2624-3346(-)
MARLENANTLQSCISDAKVVECSQKQICTSPEHMLVLNVRSHCSGTRPGPTASSSSLQRLQETTYFGPRCKANHQPAQPLCQGSGFPAQMRHCANAVKELQEGHLGEVQVVQLVGVELQTHRENIRDIARREGIVEAVDSNEHSLELLAAHQPLLCRLRPAAAVQAVDHPEHLLVLPQDIVTRLSVQIFQERLQIVRQRTYRLLKAAEQPPNRLRNGCDLFRLQEACQGHPQQELHELKP